jgi:hypothetical protein
MALPPKPSKDFPQGYGQALPAQRRPQPTIPPSQMTDATRAHEPSPVHHQQQALQQPAQQPQQASPQTNAASQPPPGLPAGPIDASWQRIWLRAQGRDWVSLALIGSSLRSPEATMRVAGMLARISEELGHPLVVLDARNVELRTMASIQARMRSLAARGTRAITVLQLPNYNPITVPIAQAADASMLCVFVGETRLANSTQSIEQIGRDRFLGTVILRHP